MALVFWFVTFVLFRFGYNGKDNRHNNRNCSNTSSNRNTYNHRPVGLVSCHNVINGIGRSSGYTGTIKGRAKNNATDSITSLQIFFSYEKPFLVFLSYLINLFYRFRHKIAILFQNICFSEIHLNEKKEMPVLSISFFSIY